MLILRTHVLSIFPEDRGLLSIRRRGWILNSDRASYRRLVGGIRVGSFGGFYRLR